MKKIFMLLTATMVSLSAFSQKGEGKIHKCGKDCPHHNSKYDGDDDDDDREYRGDDYRGERYHRYGGMYKATAGERTAELGLAGGLLNSSLTLNNNMGMLRSRMFIHDMFALRMGVNLTAHKERVNVYGTPGTVGSPSGYIRSSAQTVLFNIGAEVHHRGTNRLSPYSGLDLLIGGSGSSETGSNADMLGNYNQGYEYTRKDPSTFTIGLRAVVGADYYFARKVYLGIEAGLGGVGNFYGKSSLETTVGGVTTTNKYPAQGSTFDLEPTIVTGIRLGFAF